MKPVQHAAPDLVDALTAEGCARRTFLLGAAGGLATLAVGSAAAAEEATGPALPAFAYIGCFTSATRKASAKGISVYRIDQAGGWTLQQTLETVPNPQFIAFDRQQRYLYSVHGDGTEVSSYAIDKASGQIRLLNKQPTNGKNSTHLTPDPSNRYIVIGNGPGVAVFPINPDGSLAPFTDMVPAPGEVGPHRNQIGGRGASALRLIRSQRPFSGRARSRGRPDPHLSAGRIGRQARRQRSGFRRRRVPEPDHATSRSTRPSRGLMYATSSI